MKKILAILIIVFFLAAGLVRAAAIKVRPSEIKIEAKPGVPIEEVIIVENPGGNVALFEVFLDNFSDWVKIRPESFTLEAGESQKLVLEIENKERGIFSTTLSILAKPLSERKFKANSGIKIPLEIKISGEKENMLLAALYGFFDQQVSVKFLLYVLAIISILLPVFLLTKKMLKLLKIKYKINKS